MTDSPDYTAASAGTDRGLTLVRPAALQKRQREPEIFFDRHELDAILSVYGRMVADGEWRDYAMGGFKDVAVFSVFRRASEMPLYRIEKRPKLAENRAPMRWWRQPA